jgi:hypothetical protein
MKIEKKHLLILISATLLIAGGILYSKSKKIKITVETSSIEKKDKTLTLSAHNYFIQKLDTALQEVWKSFEKIGITKQRYQQALQEYRQKYLRSDYPNGSNQVSSDTKQFVQGILKEFGINPQEITIVGWNDISPAGASEKVIYINEKEFNTYSQDAKYFLIGHEIQHILHQDNCSRYTLELLCNYNGIPTEQSKESPLCQYSRFKEMRADVKTALKGKNWAQGYLDFAKEFHKRAGNNPGITHPLIQDRIALAQEILHYPTLA